MIYHYIIYKRIYLIRIKKEKNLKISLFIFNFSGKLIIIEIEENKNLKNIIQAMELLFF